MKAGRFGRLGPRALLALLAAAVAIAAAVELVEQGSVSRPPHTLLSIFEDDPLLVTQPMTRRGDATVQRTLLTVKALGADRLRILVEWQYIAPSVRPAGFDGGDPAAYPAANWAPYDRIDRLARQDGLPVIFDVSGETPRWAVAAGAPAGFTDDYRPNASAFGRFVTAVGLRYDGRYRAPAGPGAASGGVLPRVSAWSVWNEPNQEGWITPQWAQDGAGSLAPVSARIYRSLVDAAWSALAATGHRRDTILVGETAPEGNDTAGPEQPMPPMTFVRALYCVDATDLPLRGVEAAALGCPAGGARAAFVRNNPALFDATGFAHHPYDLDLSPSVSLPEPNFVPLADLDRLETGLDAVFAAYGVTRTIPIWLTEYGYQTDPPRPRRATPNVTLREQSLYLDEAEYIAWKDPRLRSLAQYELRDSKPIRPGDWSDSFQTGLEYQNGTTKPAFGAYRLPIFLPRTSGSRGSRLLVWGMLRDAPNGTTQTALVQWRPLAGGASSYRTIANVRVTNATGIFETQVRFPGSGAVHIRWIPGIRGAAPQDSRAVGIVIGR